MRFTVTVREIHCSYREVEADTWKEAVTKSADGDYIAEHSEYSHTPELPIDILSHVSEVHSTDDYVTAMEWEKNKPR